MGHASGQLLPAENVLSEEDGTVIFMPGRGSKNPGFAEENVFFSQMGNLLLGESVGHICFGFLKDFLKQIQVVVACFMASGWRFGKQQETDCFFMSPAF